MRGAVRVVVVIAALLAAVSPTPAAGTDSLQRLFPHQAELHAEGSGLCRLELGPEILTRCRADLADLRIFDAAGRELPYLVESSPPAELEVLRRVRARILEVDRHTTDDEPPTYTERYTLAVPGLPADAIGLRAAGESGPDPAGFRENAGSTGQGSVSSGEAVERRSL